VVDWVIASRSVRAAVALGLATAALTTISRANADTGSERAGDRAPVQLPAEIDLAS